MIQLRLIVPLQSNQLLFLFNEPLSKIEQAYFYSPAKKPLFHFELSESSAEHNYKIMEQFNFSLSEALMAQVNTPYDIVLNSNQTRLSNQYYTTTLYGVTWLIIYLKVRHTLSSQLPTMRENWTSLTSKFVATTNLP